MYHGNTLSKACLKMAVYHGNSLSKACLKMTAFHGNTLSKARLGMPVYHGSTLTKAWLKMTVCHGCTLSKAWLKLTACHGNTLSFFAPLKLTLRDKVYVYQPTTTTTEPIMYFCRGSACLMRLEPASSTSVRWGSNWGGPKF